MLRIDNLNQNQVVTITASGQLTKEDYAHLLPELEELLRENAPLRFYITLENFAGFEMGALWEDFKFDHKYKNQFGKTAIVGEKKSEEWGAKVARLFFDGEMRFYYKDQQDEAWQWVNS